MAGGDVIDTTPVIVGVAQWTNKGPDHLDPLRMCIRTSEQAIADAGGNVSLLSPL